MTTPVFRNDKSYVVSVPTPYGGSLSVTPGYSVSGTYFIEFHRQSPVLTFVKNPESIKAKFILCNFNTARSEKEAILDTATAPESEVAKEIAEPPKNKGGRPPKAKSLEATAKDLWKEVTFVLPDSSDVDGMNSEEISKLGQKLSIPKTLSDTAQRIAIKEKLRSS